MSIEEEERAKRWLDEIAFGRSAMGAMAAQRAADMRARTTSASGGGSGCGGGSGVITIKDLQRFYQRTLWQTGS
jgi:hypothetical protein